jgi:hypothetical protein
MCLSWNNIYTFFNYTHPLRCLLVPPGVRVPPVEYHCVGAIPTDDTDVLVTGLMSARHTPGAGSQRFSTAYGPEYFLRAVTQ